jgi:hypothetical protein
MSGMRDLGGNQIHMKKIIEDCQSQTAWIEIWDDEPHGEPFPDERSR